MIQSHKFFILSVTAIILVFLISTLAFFGITGITGYVTTQAYIYKSIPTNCSFVLHPGKNFVSFFCEAPASLDSVLIDENNDTIDYESVFTYVSGDSDPWKSYNSALPSWTVQDDIIVDRRPGYWIIMDHSALYNKTGIRFFDTKIGLKNGWNLIGYPSTATRNITDALSQLNGSALRVDSYQYIINQSDNESNSTPIWNPKWLVYVPNGTSNTLDYMEPNYAFWVKTNESKTLTINW